MSDLSSSAHRAKTCSVCGKNLTGQPRVKDREGRYYCIPCDDAEKDRLAGGRAACAECKRIFRRDKLIDHGSDLVCEPCAILRQRRFQRLRKSGLDVDLRRAQQVQRGAVLLGVLLLILLVLWIWL